MMKKRWISLLLAVCMVLQLCSSMAFAAELESDPVFPISGKCGMNLTWTLAADGTMTISGSGAMFSDYNFYDEDLYKETPWFEYVDSIEKIVVEEGVTSIAPFAFFNCYMAQSIEIPTSATEIGEYAFAWRVAEFPCYVIFKGNAPTFDENAFCESTLGVLCYVEKKGWADLIVEPEDPYEPSEFAGGRVYWLCADENGIIASGNCGEDDEDEDYDFEDNLTWTLSIDGTLTITGSGVMTGFPDWQNYRGLIVKVILPEGLTTIGTEAFFRCTNLTEITIPDSVITIGDNAFGDCYALDTVSMGGSVQTIGSYAFGYADITEIEIPDTVIEIGSGAFSRCTALTAITFLGDAPTFVYEQYNEIFQDVTATCYYPADNTTWTEDVRQNYGGTLTWVPVEDETEGDSGETPDVPGVPTSGTCGNDLTWTLDENGTLTISGTGEMYDYNLSDNCAPWDPTSIKQIVFSEDCEITKIGEHVFANCTELASVELPTTLKKIGNSAFYCCTGLETVTLAEGLTEIDGMAFIGCEALTEITIPVTVTTIGYRAFAFTGMTKVTMLGSEPEVGEDIFQGCSITTYANWASWLSTQWGTVLPLEGGAPEEPADTTPPTLTVTGPENGATLCDLYVTFTVSASDESDIASIIMSYEKDGETVTVTEAPYEINLHPLGDRVLEVTFTVTDIYGNTTSETRSYTIDIYPDAPAGLTAVNTVDGVRLTWTSGGNVEMYYIYLQDTNGYLIDHGYTDQTATTWLDTSVQAGETYTYVVAAEALSQLMAYSEPVTITYVSPDTTAPVIHEVWPTTEEDVTFCHDGTLQVAASDETALDRAEAYANGVLIGSAGFDGSGLAAIEWDCADLSGTVTLTYVVYDKAGNSAEATADVTIRVYTAPATPTNLTVENGFRSATIRWNYEGDPATLKQFNIYDGDPDGGMLVTTVKDYKYTFRDLSEEATFKVAAVDIYGQQSFSTEPITVTPVLTESEKPVARLQASELTAVTGTAITLTGAGSTDNDKIASYTWDFGDGTTAEGIHATHTYTEAREYTVTLTVTDRSNNTGTATCTVTVYDTLGADATHAMLTVTVKDGYTAGTPAIENATVTVYSDGFEAVSLTDSVGQAMLVVPKGTHTMTVVKDGFDGKMGEIEVTPDESGSAAKTIYLAESGVSVVDGELTVTPMTREEMEEVGIDPDDPANNHVVKQQTTIRFQPMPEVAFDIPVEQIFDALGNLIPDKSSGFGWHTFTPDPDPDDPEDDEEEDDDNDRVPVEDIWPTKPKYDVGVFPVGDSAYMVIYGQSHWLKEMFNVELIVYNNSYAQDITDCVAELNLPEGLSLAAMLEGEQTEQVYIGQIDYIGKTDGSGTAISLPTRQVNWYVRGDAEGDYNLTAAVDGMVGGDPFQTSFTTADPIHVYAGSALLLTVTMPKSAYAEKEYAVKFSLTNVSDKPIYNLTFGIDTAQQFVAERMSDGSTGEIEREYSNEDFEGGMTYGLPTLEPGKAFNLVLKTTFAYEHQFVEWAVGRIPLDVAEVGYQVADCFVTTLEGSTTEIPVEIILEDVKKDNIFQWIWDSTIGALKENTKETVIELVDDKIFQGVPVIEKGVEIVEVVTNIMGELEETEIEYIPTVNVTDGVQCVPKNEVDDWLSAFDTYSLRSTAPGIIVWTDAVDAEISEDGRSMTMPSGGKLYMLRLGETAVTPEIAVTTYYVDGMGEVQSFTQTLTTEETYTSGLQNAKYILLNTLIEASFEIPKVGEILTVPFDGWLIAENGDILLRAANECWTIEGENTDGLDIVDGRLVIGSEARAGIYTVQLALEGTDQTFEQTIILAGDDNTGSGDDNTGSGDDNTGSGDDNTGSGDNNTGSGDDNTGSNSGSSSGSSGTSKPGTSNKPSGKDEQKRDLPFGDIDTDDWFAESVGYVYEKGLMKGTSEKAFSPYADTSRAMIVTILWRLAGSPVVNYLMPFEDVPQELWYSEAVRWAAAEGIVGGYSATEFRPEGNITREQFAAILWRYAKFMDYDVSVGEDINILSYDDAFHVSEYAIPAMQWSCGAGILRGKTESTLNPMDGAIRAEAATILMRFCENIIN